MAGAAITYDHKAGGSNLYGAFASGTYTADDTTPVAVNILCGFQPSRIYLFNTVTLRVIDWVKGMAAAKYMNIIDTGIGTTDITYAASGGPVVYAGGGGHTAAVDSHDGGHSEGFTIPAALQAASDLIVWIAYR